LTKPELGVKRDCPNCGARFYDLNKQVAHCPKCEHEFTPEALLKPRKRREDEVQDGAEAAPKPAAETSLSEADKENKGAKSKRKPGLDDEGGEAAEGEDIDIEDIEVDVDDDDDDTLLEEDEDDADDDVGDIVGGGGGEDA
jgi:uncharacterized protein (TIGR02300 family)